MEERKEEILCECAKVSGALLKVTAEKSVATEESVFQEKAKIESMIFGMETSIMCMICRKELSTDEVISCQDCKCGKYCSPTCMEKHENHSKYCKLICEVQKVETEKRIKKEIFSINSEKLPYKKKLALVRLVGERPIVNMHLND